MEIYGVEKLQPYIYTRLLFNNIQLLNNKRIKKKLNFNFSFHKTTTKHRENVLLNQEYNKHKLKFECKIIFFKQLPFYFNSLNSVEQKSLILLIGIVHINLLLIAK